MDGRRNKDCTLWATTDGAGVGPSTQVGLLCERPRLLNRRMTKSTTSLPLGNGLDAARRRTAHIEQQQKETFAHASPQVRNSLKPLPITMNSLTSCAITAAGRAKTPAIAPTTSTAMTTADKARF